MVAMTTSYTKAVLCSVHEGTKASTKITGNGVMVKQHRNVGSSGTEGLVLETGWTSYDGTKGLNALFAG